ncbi:acyltransferase [Leuconostoc litchii]|uniref:Alpha/beta hydrolase n=1 Tax=Leuconostoc litchii TaxID=1981069 RepID=A0A652NEG3_9LACO|nr:alpha/beta hydrolase [Leuconostoc litchii]TYC46539.1 alpha/beta hydrolase [Leuconostoc litchii]GMA70139.1 acyltransferase [Leuconostoc litchii]
MRNKLIIIFSFILLIIIGIFGQNWVTNTRTTQSKIQTSHMSPIILIPGSSASVNRFDNLLTKLNVHNQHHDILKVQVKKNNQLVYSGKIRSNDDQPFIIIGFENNADGYNNIKKQSKWLDIAMADLQDRYHFRNFQGIGHSNGGLIWTRYLENYYDADNLNMTTLMTLGTPFNFSESSSQRRTVMLKDYIEKSSNLPSSLIMYSIAGTEDYTDDGIVPVQSVLAGKYIFQKRVKSYTQITVSGDDAQHSSLPENKEVMRLIQEHILSQTDNNDFRKPK